MAAGTVTATAPAAPTRHEVTDASQVRSAVEHVRVAARDAGFGAPAVESIVLAATELAQNLHRHAVGGELVLLPPVDPQDGLVLVALDRGPGVGRFEVCLVDGFTTIGTMGVGLGTVRRLSHRFDAVSEPGRGTVVAATFRHDAAGRLRRAHPVIATPPRPFDVAAVGFAIHEDLPNGDAWVALHRGARLIVAVSDGLGHGPAAAEASRAVIGALPGVADLSPAEMMPTLAAAAHDTRGAAVTVVTLPVLEAVDGGVIDSAGFGNVALVVFAPDGTSRRAISFPGTVGRATPPARGVPVPFPAGGTLVLHTDGLQSRWDLDGRSDVLRHDAVVVAAVLWRDFERGSDDSCVVVVRGGSHQ